MDSLEKYLITSLVIDPDSIRNVKDLLSPNALQGDDYKNLYRTILEMEERGEDVDRFSLFMANVIPAPRLEKILSVETEGVILDGERFARFILKRNLEADFQQAAKEKDIEAGKEAVDNLLSIDKGPVWKSIAALDSSDHRGQVFKSGFKIDTFVRLRQSDLCIIAGKTGIGKSTLGMNFLQNMANENPVGLISFEMPEWGISRRIKQAMTGHEIKEKEDVYFVAFPMSFNLSVVRRIAREMIDRKGVKVVMVDFLQLMSETKRFSSRHLEVSYIVRQLKEIAKQLDVLMILISSLGRSLDNRGKKEKPLLSDLKESGDIEYAADQVIFLHRENDETTQTEMIVAKNRYGKRATENLIFQPEKGKYIDA